MTFAAHDDAVRTSIRRVSTIKVDDSGSQQLVDASGFEGDAPTGMVRIQSHGFSSNPPVGSEGLVLNLGGRGDRGMVVGLEHPDHKPKNLPAGESAFYNAGSVLLQTSGDDLNLNQDGTFNLKIKSLVFTAGNVTFTLDANGLTMTGGKITHNDHDIGSDHAHTNAGGSGLSGPPQ